MNIFAGSLIWNFTLQCLIRRLIRSFKQSQQISRLIWNPWICRGWLMPFMPNILQSAATIWMYFPEFAEEAVTDLITFFFKLYFIDPPLLRSYKVLLTVYLSRGYRWRHANELRVWRPVSGDQSVMPLPAAAGKAELNGKAKVLFIIFIQENIFSPESSDEAAAIDLKIP